MSRVQRNNILIPVQPPIYLPFSVFWRPRSVSSTSDTSMLLSLSRHQNECLCLTRPVYMHSFYSAGAGFVGLVWGLCALPDLMPPPTLRKPISKAIRHSDNRQFNIPQSDIRQPAPKQKEKKLTQSRAKRNLPHLTMAKRPWHVPTEYLKIGARTHGTSNFRLAGASF